MSIKQCYKNFEVPRIHKVCIIIVGLLFLYDYTYYDVPNYVQITNPVFTTLEPYNVSEPQPYSDIPNQLINLTNFTFLINPDTCKPFSSLLLIIIVSSNPSRMAHRMAIRQTWGKNMESYHLVFMVGLVDNADIENKVQEESRLYGDIIQGNFVDSYHNMTYKHAMGLKWVVTYCPMAKYVLKTDDDVFINSRGLRTFLTRGLSPWGTTDLIMCSLFVNAKVERFSSKWSVAYTDYTGKFYPTYCGGWAVLYSQDVVPKLLEVTQKIPYFWIDDVHITGVAAERIGVPRTELGSLILKKYQADKMLRHKQARKSFLLGPPNIEPEYIANLWTIVSAKDKKMSLISPVVINK